MNKSATVIAGIALSAVLAGCGFLDNKADKVLGLDDPSMKEIAGDISEFMSLGDKLQSLSVGDMVLADKASNMIMAKLKSDWLPKLDAKAAELGVKEFKVVFDEEEGEGVLVLPDKASGVFSGFVSGSATADGDSTEFILRIAATISNGEVKYEFKK